MGAIGRIFDQSDFMPHGMCFLWRPDILALHVASDVLIAIAYFAIPAFLFVLSRRRDDLLPRWALHLFIAFILLCGLTHLAAVWVIWKPDYTVEGLVKLATAVVSLTTAVLVWIALRNILAIPSRHDLQTLNASLRDQIAERERTEQSLRKTQEFLRAVFDTVQSGIFACDTEGVITLTNPAARAFFGAGERVFTRDGWGTGEYVLYESGGENPVADELRPLYRAFHAGVLPPTDVVVGLKDGSRRSLQARGRAMVDESGEKFGAVVSMEDVTDIRAAETELRRLNAGLEESVRARTAELMRSNADLERFASVASHDLQEPLRSVAGFCGLLQKKYAGKLDPEATGFIKQVVDGATRMQTLIEDILAYSRLRPAVEETVAVRLDAVLEKVLDSLSDAIESAGARIAADSLPTVVGVPFQLEQLLQNLLSNALKYRGDRPPEISIGAERDGAVWRITVADNGIGFDQRFADRIFQLFQRLHARDQYWGSGMGLAICHKVVTGHGGRIWAESTEGVGSHFRFTLPAADVA